MGVISANLPKQQMRHQQHSSQLLSRKEIIVDKMHMASSCSAKKEMWSKKN